MKINVGCGMTPTLGWENFDNSFSVKISKYFYLALFLFRAGVINKSQMNYIEFCRNNNIHWADAKKHLPFPNGSVDVIYSSHMLEHLDSDEAKLFLIESRRVLKKDGVIRIVVPDLRKKIELYTREGSADRFVSSLGMTHPNPRTFFGKVKFLIVGWRHHLWMYDETSLQDLLMLNGFSKTVVLKPGETTISDPGSLNLFEREEESLYVEARQV